MFEAAVSRRELAAGTVALDGIGGLGASVSDAKVLRTLLEVERRLSLAYRRVLASGSLNVVVAAELTRFEAQEREHIGALERELSISRASPEGFPAPLGPVLQTQGDALTTLVKAEAMAQSAYRQAISQLRQTALVKLAAEIFACEAQHSTLLSILMHPQDPAAAVPAAFVTGS
jgi:hypothetical protein